MIRVLFFIEKFEHNGSHGGAEKVLCNLVNHMDPTRFDITVKTLWPCDFDKYLASYIHRGSVYPRFDAAHQLLYRAEAAANLIYPLHLKGDYDIECAYLECGTTKIMAGSTNKRALKLAWAHCDFMTAWADPSAFAEKSRRWYEKFDAVPCVSQTVQTSFRHLFGSTPPSRVIYNTIDDEEIRRKAEASLPEDMQKQRFTVVSIGRLDAQKNYMRMLKACRQLLSEGFDFDLWILGKGDEQAMLEDYIRQHHLEDHIRLFGFRANPYPAIRCADLLACSSNYEGFSTFITEGLVLGKPIVTTECSGMRELLGDSEYGLITANSDADFYTGLREMLSSAELRAQYAAAAAERGVLFSTAELVQKTEQYLIESLDKKQKK